MMRFGYKRRIGCGAAFIAAYALLFNLILSSILAAGVSPAAVAAAHELCSSSGNLDAGRTGTDKNGKKLAIHCPSCAGHHTPTALPSPQAALADRRYVELVIAVAFEARFVAAFRSHDHQSRGPPFLI
ncbi:DUF2946 family protein [Bradyrhizobium sp. CCGB20]|uniref:DUF2946 family protein n=1 Tax=Bradyrhizobium sp. CCGB20 TaxID=2949633 RepID=UPI0020B2F7AE|nr:DUF2946 family protein [Bradyrhizobium sp. CCGB20]MCP3400196.1 DUF2946 family protein [Bradyrhizobium sp. CCGB20]